MKGSNRLDKTFCRNKVPKKKKPNVTHRSSFSRHKRVDILLDDSAIWSRPWKRRINITHVTAHHWFLWDIDTVILNCKFLRVLYQRPSEVVTALLLHLKVLSKKNSSFYAIINFDSQSALVWAVAILFLITTANAPLGECDNRYTTETLWQQMLFVKYFSFRVLYQLFFIFLCPLLLNWEILAYG